MPKYLLILRDDPADFAKMSPAEMQACIEKYIAWSKALGAKGHMVGGEKLDLPGTVLSRKKGDVIRQDGPFGETKEIVGGYYLIRADSLQHAAELCSDHPQLENGTVEIRPIDTFGAPDAD